MIEVLFINILVHFLSVCLLPKCISDCFKFIVKHCFKLVQYPSVLAVSSNKQKDIIEAGGSVTDGKTIRLRSLYKVVYIKLTYALVELVDESQKYMLIGSD